MITKVWAVINQRARLSRPVIFNCTGAPKCLPRRGLGSASCKELAAAALQTVHRHRPWLWAHTAAVSPLSWGRSHSIALQTCPSPPLHRDGGRTSQLCVPERDRDKQFSSFPSGRRHSTALSAAVSFQHRTGTTEPICELRN